MAGSGLGGGRPAPGMWQHPFVDVFKSFESPERRGDVAEDLDRQICKQVLRIRGAVSANNYIRLPPSKSSTKTLGLTGEYVYIQVKSLEMKFFVVHLDFSVSAANATRITLSNMYTDVKSTHHSVQCPCHLPESHWAVVCAHIPSILARFSKVPPHAFTLKTIQFCASLYVRGLFVSDILYTPETLPRDMQLDSGGHSSFATRHVWIDIPACIQEVLPANQPKSHAPIAQKEMHLELANEGLSRCHVEPERTLPQFGLTADEYEDTSSACTRTADSSQAEARPISTISKAMPDPMLQVSRLIGVSRKNRKLPGLTDAIPRRFAVFIRSGGAIRSNAPVRPDVNSGVVYASSMTLTVVDPLTRAQQCFFGHSRPIELLEASDDGLWVASVQGADSGAPPVLRLWHVETCGGLKCICVLSCPSLSSVRVACFDALAKSLALAGTDLQGRQHLMVWDISRLSSGGNITLLAKQTSADWDIDCIKFSPFEEMNLVTCGKESIRFWRVKDGHLPGCSVVLNSLARQSHFTCVAFEFNKMGQPYFLGEHLGDRHRMFVGTNKGKLLQLSYKDRKVQVVYQLHNAAITAMCANEGFVVTASADKYVRVWPLDFKSYYVHAMHDAIVAGVDITVDGLQVLCSTADGSVGMLDMQSHNYVDLVNTHGATITDAAVSIFYQEVVTASRDGTLKVWSLTSMTQTQEYTIDDDVPLIVAFHPAGRHLIAGGFRSGCMRVFDVDGPNMLCEFRHHVQPILSLAFVKDASQSSTTCNAQVVTCDTTGALVFHDESCNFEVVRCPERILCTPPPEHCPAMVCSPPCLLQYFDPHCIGILSFPGLELKRKLRIPHGAVCTFALSVDARLAVIGTVDSKIQLFEVSAGNHVATYTFGAGQFSAVAFTSFHLGDPFQGLGLLMVAAADSQVRVAQLRLDEILRQTGNVSRASGIGSQNLASPACIPYDFFNEQCFIGHATSPHRILVTPKCLVTVSHSEVVCWASVGNYFEQLFLGSVLGNRQGTCRLKMTEPQMRVATTDLPNTSESADGMSSPGLQGDVPHVFDEASQSEMPNCNAPLLSPMASESMCLTAEFGESTDENLEPGRERKATSVELEVAFGGADLAFREKASLQKMYKETDVALAGALCDSSEGRSVFHNVTFNETEQQPQQDIVAPLCDSSNLVASLEADESDQRCGTSADVFIRPYPRDEKLASLRLQGLAGCATGSSAQPFAWRPQPGILCHTVGCIVHVDRLNEAHDELASYEKEAQLINIPGTLVLGLDLSPDDEHILGVLSVDRCSSSGHAWLSLWHVESLGSVALVELQQDYVTNTVSDGSDIEPNLRVHQPLLRLAPGGDRVVTTTSRIGNLGGRVDVWALHGNYISLLTSAEVHFNPLALLLLSAVGDEFLTLSVDHVMFWRCSENNDIENGVNLLFQEADSNGQSFQAFSAFCLVQLPSWQMLLAGTQEGRMLAYNADENLMLANVLLTTQGSINAMASSKWPLLVCGIGHKLQVFKLEQSSENLLQVTVQGRAFEFDGLIQTLGLHSLAGEGIVSTSANTLWYFNMQRETKVCLESFHNVPSRMIKSNSALLEQSVTNSHDEVVCLPGAMQHPHEFAMPEVFVTCADDGCLCVWSSMASGQSCAQILAKLHLSSTCVAMGFLTQDTLACGLFDGHVCVYNMNTLALVSSIEVSSGDPILALEATSSSSLVVGCAGGRLFHLMLDDTRLHASYQLPRPDSARDTHCAAVCGIVLDREVRPSLFMVWFASLEVWLWECQSCGNGMPKHVRTWPWPESQPKPAPLGCCQTHSRCLDLLSSPQLVACFAQAHEAESLAVVCAPAAACFYVYSCEHGRIVNRIALGQQIPAVVRLWAPPPRFQMRVEGGRQVVPEAPAAIVLVLCEDRFSRLRLWDGGEHACLLDEPIQLPGCCAGLWPRRGTPSACWFRGKEQEVDRGGNETTLRVMLKGEAALSSWIMAL